MRMSLGQNTQAPEQGQGLVSTVMVATPEAVRRGLACKRRIRAASAASVTFHDRQRSGSSAFTFR